MKERLGLKIFISFSSKCVLPNPYEIIGLYLLRYIEHKGTNELWSNGLTKAIKREDRTMGL